jgi:hypothetical protein
MTRDARVSSLLTAGEDAHDGFSSSARAGHATRPGVGAMRLAFALLPLSGGICGLSSLGIPSSGSTANYNLATPHCRVLELQMFKLKALTRSAAFRMFSLFSKE